MYAKISQCPHHYGGIHVLCAPSVITPEIVLFLDAPWSEESRANTRFKLSIVDVGGARAWHPFFFSLQSPWPCWPNTSFQSGSSDIAVVAFYKYTYEHSTHTIVLITPCCTLSVTVLVCAFNMMWPTESSSGISQTLHVYVAFTTHTVLHHHCHSSRGPGPSASVDRTTCAGISAKLATLLSANIQEKVFWHAGNPPTSAQAVQEAGSCVCHGCLVASQLSKPWAY